MIKTIIAAPPDVHRINEKHRPEYYIPNVNGVIITSNYLTNGIYLPVDDRRHSMRLGAIAPKATLRRLLRPALALVRPQGR